MNMKGLSKGPQGPRRTPEQTRAAKKAREILEQQRQEENARKIQEAGKRFEASPESDSPGFKKGGKVSSASKRADGCAMKGKTKGKFV